MRITAGDHFLLYTHGVIESQNARGSFFGDSKFEEVVGGNQSRPPSKLGNRLLFEIRQWPKASRDQQDDITIVAIEVLS